MKVHKNYIGKEVKITWKDPVGKRVEYHEAKIGRAALATWVERGKIDDVTEGVVRIVQSEAWSAGEFSPDEGQFGWIPEELIEVIEIMEPAKNEREE